jgi:predicted RNA-binding protein with PIN domain
MKTKAKNFVLFPKNWHMMVFAMGKHRTRAQKLADDCRAMQMRIKKQKEKSLTPRQKLRQQLQKSGLLQKKPMTKAELDQLWLEQNKP